MYFRSLSAIILGLVTGALILGCAKSEGPVAPIIPDTTVQQALDTDSGPNPHQLWGYFQIEIDAATSEANIIPLRNVMYHLNAIPFVEKNGHSIMQLKDIVIVDGSVELNVGLVHPFPGLYQWSGFDVHGIFISDASLDNFPTDGDIVMADVDEPRLLNPDGWMRWWNPDEFPLSHTILGYTDGVYGPKDSQVGFRATINPFKYYSDDLSLNATFPDDLDFDQRGLFLASSQANWRHYSIDFGAPANRYLFNYAIDASHRFADDYDGHSTPGYTQVPDPFFPIEANMPEAFAITIKDSLSTLYYEGPTSFGGDLILFFNVYDWQGMHRPGGIIEEIQTVQVESPDLTGNNIFEAVPVDGDDATYVTYMADMLNCYPKGLHNQEVLISVFSTEGAYEEGYDEYDTNFKGNASLAAYYVFQPLVSPEIPPQMTQIYLSSPNGGEVWETGSQHNITWTSIGDIDFVIIEFSQDGGDNWEIITEGTPNDGLYENWDTSEIASVEMLVRVSDANPDGDASDQSDELFAIEYIEVTYPNLSGDNFRIELPGQYIQWEIGSGTTEVVEYVDIEFSENNGSNYSPLTNNIPAGNGQWEWIPDYDDITDEGRIRITAVGSSGLSDESDEAFEVFESIELTLDEYITWFTGGVRNFRGRYSTILSGMSMNYYNGTVTSWDFTTTPLSSYIGTSTFTVSFNTNPPLIAGAPSWGGTSYGFRTSISGTAGRRPWWVFRFDTTNELLYNRGTSYYQDATFDDLTLPGWCLDYIPCNMTETFTLSTSNDIQFPLDEDSGTTPIGGSGFLYWVNYDIYCSSYNDQWAVSYQTGSEFDVIAYGDVTVPHNGGTNYPHCLLTRLMLNIGPTTQIVHTGQLFYQWIDCDTGLVVAFMLTHNEGNSTVGIPYTTGYNGDQVMRGIIGAYD